MKETTLSSKLYYPPGGILIWILIFLELFTFGTAMIVMQYYSKVETDIFHESSQHLNKVLGTINTILLISSGYLMAQSVHFLKAKNYRLFKLTMIGTIIGGVLFIAIKSFEYSDKINEGLILGLNTFWNFYWMLTLFHLVHVIVGIVILLILFIGSKKKYEQEEFQLDIEAGASFWHMCDLIWLLLFPLLYLVY